MGGMAYGVTVGPVAISSGTNFYTVDTSSISGRGNRQNVAIGDPTGGSQLAPVDAITGLVVQLATSSANGIGTINNTTFGATKSGTWNALGVDVGTGTWPVSIFGGSIANTSFAATQTTNSSLRASVMIDGSSNTVAATKSGTWNAVTVDVGTGTWPVSIVGGGASGGTSSNFTAAFPTAGTAVGGINSDGKMQAFRVDSSSNIYVNIAAGAAAGGTSSNYVSAFPSAGTAVGFINSSGNMQAARVDTSSNVLVSIVQNGVFGATVTYNGTQTVSANQGTAGTSAWKVDFSTGVQVIQGTAGTSAWKVDLSTGVQVNGTVTSNQGTAGTSAWKIDATTGIAVVGNVASGASDSGNPVKQGAVGRTTYQTAVTDGQRVDVQADSEGKQVVMPYAVPALSTSGVTAAMTGTTDTILVSSGGSNINTYITHISCFNSHATVGTVINFKNGTTTRYTGYAVAAGGGFAVTFPTPLAGAANTQWTATNATTGSNTYCDMAGYFAKN